MEYNILSLALGCFAWITAILAILVHTQRAAHRLSVGSLGLCTFSLLSQFGEIRRRCEMGDATAIYDTIDAILLAAAVLIGVTLLLNAISMCKTERSR